MVSIIWSSGDVHDVDRWHLAILSSASYCIATTLHASTVSVVATSVPLVVAYGIVCMVESSVHPYDVLEAEPEIVSGYYVDYGGVAFMVIYLGEGIALPRTMSITIVHMS